MIIDHDKVREEKEPAICLLPYRVKLPHIYWTYEYELAYNYAKFGYQFSSFISFNSFQFQLNNLTYRGMYSSLSKNITSVVCQSYLL